jgi:hypothetical protein
MPEPRKIKLVARNMSFAEAEEKDDMYWANATFEERLNELISLRMIFFGGNTNKKMKMQKVVNKRRLHEEAN